MALEDYTRVKMRQLFSKVQELLHVGEHRRASQQDISNFNKLLEDDSDKSFKQARERIVKQTPESVKDNPDLGFSRELDSTLQQIKETPHKVDAIVAQKGMFFSETGSILQGLAATEEMRQALGSRLNPGRSFKEMSDELRNFDIQLQSAPNFNIDFVKSIDTLNDQVRKFGQQMDKGKGSPELYKSMGDRLQERNNLVHSFFRGDSPKSADLKQLESDQSEYFKNQAKIADYNNQLKRLGKNGAGAYRDDLANKIDQLKKDNNRIHSNTREYAARSGIDKRGKMPVAQLLVSSIENEHKKERVLNLESPSIQTPPKNLPRISDDPRGLG